MALVTIDSTAITDPTGCDLGVFRITKAERAASGLMNMDTIATKKRLDLTWSKITKANLKTILDLLDASTFHTVIYPDPQGATGTATKTFYVGDVSMGKWYTIGGTEYYQDAKIPLIER